MESVWHHFLKIDSVDWMALATVFHLKNIVDFDQVFEAHSHIMHLTFVSAADCCSAEN